MPNCFTLTRRGDSSPSAFGDIDRELCQNLDLPYDDNQWTCQWYNTIGLGLALGHDLPKLMEIYKGSPNLVRIAAYLNEHYTTDAWYERK